MKFVCNPDTSVTMTTYPMDGFCARDSSSQVLMSANSCACEVNPANCHGAVRPDGNPLTCPRDPSCFDANYECTGCCATGLAKDGKSCWTAVYTKSRCCNSAPPAAATPVPTQAPVPFNSCAADNSCFDANYECAGCCATGRAKNGQGCWTEVYTRDRCCNDAAVVTTPTRPTVPVVPTIAIGCAKDTACFDANYVCDTCCATGVSKNGASCWTAVYNQDRCCNSLAPVTGGVFPTEPPVFDIADGCIDLVSECSIWASMGECGRLADFMSKSCPFSCGVCGSTPTSPTPLPLAIGKPIFVTNAPVTAPECARDPGVPMYIHGLACTA